MSAPAAPGQDGPLALICGGGTLPLAVADSVSKRGRPVVLFALRGHADPNTVARYPHHWIRIGQLGAFTRLARAAGCRDVVFIGSLVRPTLWMLRPDLKALMLLPRIVAAYRGGDNHLLSGVSQIVEDHGFHLLGAHEIVPEILVPVGLLGRIDAADRHREDIAFGFDYLRASGAFDIGQAVVVAGKRVLAVEAAEGTHAVFMHSIRDVASWVTSLLDMVLRKRLARRLVDVPYSIWETEYLDDMTERTYKLDPGNTDTDQASLAPLMRYWGAHMRRMAAVLPPGRTLRLRTRDIAARFPELANLVGVPVETLRADLTHVNKAPLRFDRFTAFDSPELRAVYDEHCADIMAELFPDEHSKWVNARSAPENRPIQDWDAYISALLEWVAKAVKASGVGVTR